MRGAAGGAESMGAGICEEELELCLSSRDAMDGEGADMSPWKALSTRRRPKPGAGAAWKGSLRSLQTAMNGISVA